MFDFSSRSVVNTLKYYLYVVSISICIRNVDPAENPQVDQHHGSFDVYLIGFYEPGYIRCSN